MKITGEKFKEIDSTQLHLKRQLELNPQLPHLYYVLSETQSQGRGRGDHEWISLKGNFHASVLLKDLPFLELTWIPHWISVCLLNSLIDMGIDGTQIQLKWPNDLWVERSKKIAGILCEKKGETIIVGIGLNLLNAPSDAAKLDQRLNCNELLSKLLNQLSLPTTMNQVREAYEKHMLFKIGDEIQWKQDSLESIVSGVMIGLGSYGELLVNVSDKATSLFVEDVRFLRFDQKK